MENTINKILLLEMFVTNFKHKKNLHLKPMTTQNVIYQGMFMEKFKV